MLGQGFTSADDLVEVDIGSGDKPGPTFIRQRRYAEWISNVVPVYKKNGKLRVCIDFRNLNKATPMDGYPMPVADLLVNAAAGHRIISFMDGNAGYNQIFMAEEDIPKTAFRCPGHVGLFEWIVMTFGLKNAGATYQRAMNFILHEFIGKLVEILLRFILIPISVHLVYRQGNFLVSWCTRGELKSVEDLLMPSIR